jgi:hypothetical protein
MKTAQSLEAFFILFIIFAVAVPAFAQETAPKLPTCGKTAEECQKVVNERDAALAIASKRIATYAELLREANDRFVAAVAK